MQAKLISDFEEFIQELLRVEEKLMECVD